VPTFTQVRVSVLIRNSDNPQLVQIDPCQLLLHKYPPPTVFCDQQAIEAEQRRPSEQRPFVALVLEQPGENMRFPSTNKAGSILGG